jgi:hypothetical protein
MKITNSEIIKNGEQELMDAITADLDWSAIEKIIMKEHNLRIEEDIEYKSGDIVAVNNQIAYKLLFEVKVNLSVMIDRNGDYLSVNIDNRKEVTGEEQGPPSEKESDHLNLLSTDSADEMDKKVGDILDNIKSAA